MTLEDIAAAYSAAFPRYPTMWVDRGWLMGVWVLGNLYKRASPLYGAFPGNFLKRVRSLFPNRTRTLHLFSGAVIPLQGEITCDKQITPLVQPMVVGHAHHLPFREASFDFVLADPPYSSADAAKYGEKMIVRRKVMRELARVVSPGGYLAWLDATRPMYRADEWTQVGAVMVLISSNTRVRCLSIFQRRA